MRKKILVTGAAGFLGCFLCDELISRGYFVVGIDNFFRGSPDNVHHLSSDDFILEELDMSLPENIDKMKVIVIKNKIETIFHLAAINGTEYFYEKSFFVLDQNIRITQNLLSAIEGTSVNYLIYTSSSEVYGDPLTLPTNENAPIMLNAQSDRDSYAASKAIDEFYIQLFAKQHHKSCLILRVFNLYGEKMVGTHYGQVVPEFINRMLYVDNFTIIGDGQQTRSFCYIKDATWMMGELMEKKIVGLTNLGNDEEISILDLAKTLHDLEQLQFNPIFLAARPHDHKRRRPDITYLMSLLPSKEFTSLRKGLRSVISAIKRS